MNKLLLLLLTAAATIAATVGTLNIQGTANIASATISPSAPAGPVSFSDNFNRTAGDSMGANWSEVTGDFDIVSDTAQCTSSSLDSWLIYTGTQCSTADQYIKVKLAAWTSTCEAYLIFRSNADATTNYQVSFHTDFKARFYGPSGEITNHSETIAQGDTWAVTIKGTGASTVVRYWRNTTANAPDSGGTTWDSAAPTYQFNVNPSPAVDTGTYVGVGTWFNGSCSFDDFYAGDIP